MTREEAIEIVKRNGCTSPESDVNSLVELGLLKLESKADKDRAEAKKALLGCFATIRSPQSGNHTTGHLTEQSVEVILNKLREFGFKVFKD